MKVLILAGGTGGHVYPALAVAQALRARGHEVVWAGAPDGFEAREVPKHGFPLEPVRVRALRGKGALRWLAAPWSLVRALWQSLAILRRHRPGAVLGMGGFAAGPGGVAAWLLRVPLVIHEQNAAAGLTNRLLAPLARRALESFPGSLRGAVTVGNPVRAPILALPAPEQRFAGRSGRLRVLVVGGSQGARVLNERVPEALARIAEAERPEVRHQAGRTLALARQSYARHRVFATLEAFIEDMPAAYAWADLVVCRAGASTVAELAGAGCAALLVPFPHAVDDHQTRNGRFLVEAGAARMIAEADLDAATLAGALRELGDRARLLAMARAARALAWGDAERRIADAVLEEGAHAPA